MLRLLPFVFVGLLFAGCSGSSSSGINAVANDFSYKVGNTADSAGKVHFTLRNDSKSYQHELWVYPQNQPKLADLRTAKNAGQDVQEADFLQGVAGKIEGLDPGKTASFDADLQPGTYEFACFIVTKIADKSVVHYDLGMHGTLTVR